MSENPERGEVSIELAGRSWVLRPTYQAITQIEAATGRTIMSLVREVTGANYSARDLAVIVTAGLRAAGEKSVEVETVGAMLVAAGIATPGVVGPVCDFLTNALSGGAKGEGKAAGESL